MKSISRRSLTLGIVIAVICLIGAIIILRTGKANQQTLTAVPPDIDVAKLPHDDKRFTGHIDGIWAPDLHAATPVVSVPKAGDIDVRGWAYDGIAKGPFLAAFVSVDGGPLLPVVYGTARGDVAANMQCDACAPTGFSAHFSGTTFPPGRHLVRLKFVTQSTPMQVVDYPDFTIAVMQTTIHIDKLAHDDNKRLMAYIDGIWAPDHRSITAPVTTVPHGAGTDIRGWAFDGSAKSPFIAAYAGIDNAALKPMEYGDPRADVADAMNCAACTSVGFFAHFSGSELKAGRHLVRLSFVTAGDPMKRVDYAPLALDVKN